MRHMDQSQRDRIQVLKKDGYSNRKIARVLWVSHRTIDKELTRNSVCWVYTSTKAQHKAYVRRKMCKKQMKKIRDNDEMEQYIRARLKDDWSPDEIAHTWNGEHTIKISTPTIYKYIDSRYGYWLHEHLYTQRPKKRRRKGKGKREIIKQRVMIDARPEIIGLRKEFWHYEVDLIMWKQWTKACLLVLIEMTTRYKIVYVLASKHAHLVEEKLHEAIKEYGIRSMTFDNGSEFAGHLNLWIATYFCYPHSPRQKPQVERGNKNIRWYYPKWTNFQRTTQEEIDIVLKKINMRPMKCLDYQSPYTLFHEKLLFRVATLGV